MTLAEIEEVILGRLAAEAGRDPDELRADLEASGAEMPCSSVLAAEVLAAVERRCGVRLPMNHDTAAAMRSVRAFAQAVLAEVASGGSAPGPQRTSA